MHSYTQLHSYIASQLHSCTGGEDTVRHARKAIKLCSCVAV
jgi:hypothetical protein